MKKIVLLVFFVIYSGIIFSEGIIRHDVDKYIEGLKEGYNNPTKMYPINGVLTLSEFKDRYWFLLGTYVGKLYYVVKYYKKNMHKKLNTRYIIEKTVSSCDRVGLTAKYDILLLYKIWTDLHADLVYLNTVVQENTMSDEFAIIATALLASLADRNTDLGTIDRANVAELRSLIGSFAYNAITTLLNKEITENEIKKLKEGGSNE